MLFLLLVVFSDNLTIFKEYLALIHSDRSCHQILHGRHCRVIPSIIHRWPECPDGHLNQHLGILAAQSTIRLSRNFIDGARHGEDNDIMEQRMMEAYERRRNDVQ